MSSFQPRASHFFFLDLYDFQTGAVPKRTLQRDLQKLVEVGLLDRLGNTRAATYQISDRAHTEIVEISITYNRERIEFGKYKSSGIAPRFSIPNMYMAVSWMIRRAFLAFRSCNIHT